MTSLSPSSSSSSFSLQEMFLEYQKEKLMCKTLDVNIFHKVIWNSMEKTLEEKEKEREIKETIFTLKEKVAQLTEKHYEMCEDRPPVKTQNLLLQGKVTENSESVVSESSHLGSNLYLLLLDQGFFQTQPNDDKTEIEYIFSQWPKDPLVPIRILKREIKSVAFVSDERNDDGRVRFFHYVDYNQNGKQPKKLSGHFVNEHTCNVVNKGIDRFFAYRPVQLSERDAIVKEFEIYSHRKLWKRSLFKDEVLKKLFEKDNPKYKNETIFRAFKVYLETLLVLMILETDPKNSRDIVSVAKEINKYLSERVFDRFEKYLPDKNPLEKFCFGYPDTVFLPGSILLTHSKFTNIYFSFKSYLCFREELKALQINLREDEIRIKYDNENKDVTDVLLASIEDTEITNHWKSRYLTIQDNSDNRLPAACWILYNYKLWSEYMMRKAFSSETRKHVTSERIRFIKEINTLANYLTECVQILTNNSTSSWW